MASSKSYRFEAKIGRQRRNANSTQYRVEADAAAPRCPWIYAGWEEPPDLPAHDRGSRVDAGDLERALDRRFRSVTTGRRARRG